MADYDVGQLLVCMEVFEVWYASPTNIEGLRAELAKALARFVSVPEEDLHKPWHFMAYFKTMGWLPAEILKPNLHQSMTVVGTSELAFLTEGQQLYFKDSATGYEGLVAVVELPKHGAEACYVNVVRTLKQGTVTYFGPYFYANANFLYTN